MIFNSMGGIQSSLMGAVRTLKDGVAVTDEELIRSECIDDLIQTAVFSEDNEVKLASRRLITQIAADLGIRSASIQGLYEAMGRGECGGFTVPAINIRGITYDTARCIFRAAKKCGSGTFIFEIAKSELGYTDQTPAEYTACILAAAVKEGHRGPVFIQGDHFQVNAANYKKDRQAEIDALKALIKEAITAQFYNIDIDSSTIVDLSQSDVREEQRPNFEVAAELTAYIREIEPEGVTVSVGGEIGEVGGKNSTEEELRAYMEGFNAALGEGIKGISKMSIQTGTSHGGVPLPDGTVAKVNLDFDTLERLGKVAREYGLCG
ncbi:MAG: class II fructose-bisphosphate aldolase, partial [Thermodesulfobacteriota bacterium]